MTDTTSISDLPTAAGGGGNITLEMKERPQKALQSAPQVPPSNVPSPLPSAAANKIVSGIQSASAANMTRLPSRDIPMATHPHTQDKQSRPNFVPQPKKQIDYIGEHDSIQSMIQKKNKQNLKIDRLETIYEEIQTPVFVMILYLLFQLPSFQKLLNRQLPALFNSDGCPKFAGYLFKTVLFGGAFYLVQKGSQYLSQT